MARLRCATVDDRGLELQLDLSGTAASRLELLDDLHTGVICDFSEDDVFAIKPGCDDRGNEELRAVTAEEVVSLQVLETGERDNGAMGDRTRACDGETWRFIGDVQRTCWDQRWPLRASQVGCAFP